MSEKKVVGTSCCALSLWCGVISLFSLTLFSFVSNSTAATLEPKLVAHEREYSFGSVAEGVRVKHDFIISNEGTADLIIKKVAPECGCTTSRIDKLVVAPNTTATLSAEFDTAGFAGKRTKRLRLFSNDPTESIAKFTLAGEVLDDAKAEPEVLRFGQIVRGRESEPLALEVKLRKESDVELLSVKPSSPYIKVVEDASSKDEERHFFITILPSAPVGDLRSRITINTSGRRKSVVTVPVIADVIGTIVVTPPVISFGLIEGKSIIERSVKIEAKGGAKLTLRQASTDNPAIKAELVSISPAAIYVVKVRLDPSLVTKEDFEGVVSIQTDEEPLLISVYGVMPPK